MKEMVKKGGGSTFPRKKGPFSGPELPGTFGQNWAQIEG